jgi:integrase
MARRSYGTGSVTVRRDSNGRETWYGSWMVGGRRVKRRLGLKRPAGTGEGLTTKQAEAELRRLMAEDVAGAACERRRTIEEAGARYVEHLEQVMRRKRTTLEDYRCHLRRHLVPFFGGRPINHIEPADVERYLRDKIAGGLAPTTVVHHVTFLGGLFRFAIKRGWASSNPVAFVDRPRLHRQASGRLRFLQPEEVEALLHAVPADELGQLERPLYLCAAMTGLRQGELLALRWRDIDWSARRVRVADNYPRGRYDRVEPTKSHLVRSVPMADRLAGELDRHFQASAWQGDDDLVFCHPHTGRPYDASKLRKRFDAALTQGRLRRVTFHELRHTFGTQMAAAGAPLRAIQEWMGHADAATTQIYAHYAPDATNGAAFAERAFGTDSLTQGRLMAKASEATH